MSIITSDQLINCRRILFISPFALGDFLYFKTFLIALKQQFSHIDIDIWLDDNRCTQDEWRLSRSKILQQWIKAEGHFEHSYGCTDSVAARDAQIDVAASKNYGIIICHSPGAKASQYSQIARRISPKGFIVSSMTKAPFKGMLNSWLLRHSNAIYTLNTDLLPVKHHITDRYYMVINSLFGLQLSQQELMPNLTIPTEINTITQQWISHNFSSEQGKIILINHLSTSSKRDWKIEQVVELIKHIEQIQPQSRFILNVTKENVQPIQQALNHAFSHDKNPPATAVFTIKEHFFELPAIIAAAEFVITVETAIMHFATATHTPLISLMRSKKSYWAPPETTSSKVIFSTKGKGYVSDIDVASVREQYIKINNINDTSKVLP